MDLKGRKVLITGASRRIGRSLAATLAKAGADILVHYHRSDEEAEDLVRVIQQMGRNAWLVNHDLADSGKTAEWFEEVSRKVDGIDLLVNSASEYREDSYDGMNADSISRSMAIHFLSPLQMIWRMYRDKQQRGEQGSVVNILDTRAAGRDSRHASYHVGKRALYMATRELALEMAPTMRINAVAPGLILPPEGKDETWLEGLKGTNPLQSYGNPKEIADAVLYLCQAGFVTGQTIFVDGGRHLKGLSRWEPKNG